MRLRFCFSCNRASPSISECERRAHRLAAEASDVPERREEYRLPDRVREAIEISIVFTPDEGFCYFCGSDLGRGEEHDRTCRTRTRFVRL